MVWSYHGHTWGGLTAIHVNMYKANYIKFLEPDARTQHMLICRLYVCPFHTRTLHTENQPYVTQSNLSSFKEIHETTWGGDQNMTSSVQISHLCTNISSSVHNAWTGM